MPDFITDFMAWLIPNASINAAQDNPDDENITFPQWFQGAAEATESAAGSALQSLKDGAASVLPSETSVVASVIVIVLVLVLVAYILHEVA